MKKFIIKFISFFTISLGICFLLYYAFLDTQFEAPQYNRVYKELTSNNKINKDINGIIIGNSRATYGLDPALLDKTGIKFYNFSAGRANSAFFNDWYDLLFKTYYFKVDHCVIVVDNVFIDWNNQRKLEQDSEYLPNHVFWELLLAESKLNKTSFFLNKFNFYKYRKKLFDVWQVESNDMFDLKRFDRGFLTFKHRNDSLNFLHKSKREFNLSKSEKDNFNELIQKFEEQNVRLYFVIPPTYQVNQKRSQQLKKYVKSIASLHQIPIFDFNEKHRISAFDLRENFADQIHVNAKGSQYFSNELAKKMIEYNQ